MNKLTTASALVLASVLVACAGGGDEPSTGGSASALSVVDACTGTVTCHFDDEDKTASLVKDASGCQLGAMTLAPGGTVVSDLGTGFTWSSTASVISLCASDGCITCTAPSAASAAPSKTATAGKCTGSAWSCDGAPGSCGTQDGCSLQSHIHIGPNNSTSLEYECEGTPKDCDEYDSKGSCENQRGCSWK